jgi:protein-S-isoprenylcysteine O-methyltransferase Ste14
MAISPSLIAFTVILVIYITVGVFAAIGTAYVSKALLPPKFEQVFYAVYLAVIAGFYLAFTVYFGSEQAWRVEATAGPLLCPDCAGRNTDAVRPHRRVSLAWIVGCDP